MDTHKHVIGHVINDTPPLTWLNKLNLMIGIAVYLTITTVNIFNTLFWLLIIQLSVITFVTGLGGWDSSIQFLMTTMAT